MSILSKAFKTAAVLACAAPLGFIGYKLAEQERDFDGKARAELARQGLNAVAGPCYRKADPDMRRMATYQAARNDTLFTADVAVMADTRDVRVVAARAVWHP